MDNVTNLTNLHRLAVHFNTSVSKFILNIYFNIYILNILPVYVDVSYLLMILTNLIMCLYTFLEKTNSFKLTYV